MITFKFNGHRVKLEKGKIHSDDESTQFVLSELVGCSDDGPEDGNPLLNTITRIFGKKAVSDIVIDEPETIIH